MKPGEMVAILLSGSPMQFVGTGRVIEVNLDESKFLIKFDFLKIQHVFRVSSAWFEELENSDGTKEYLYLQEIPGTNGMCNRLLHPTFRIGSGTSDESKQNVDTTAQSTLF
jgi:hypothetical protein